MVETNLLAGLTLGSLVGSLLLSGLALLEKGLRDENLVLGRDAPIHILSVGPQEQNHVAVVAPSEEVRHSGLLALMHSPLSTEVLSCTATTASVTAQGIA